MMPVTPSLPQLSPLSWLLAYFCRAALGGDFLDQAAEAARCGSAHHQTSLGHPMLYMATIT